MNKSLDEILQLGSVKAAPLLLGCILSRQTPEGELALKIVETEAYHQDDPASHSFRGLTLRTAPMFQGGGTIYVYFTYGMHYCVNIVVGKKGRGEAVLLRAGEPLTGIEIMQKSRGGLDKKPTTSQNPHFQGGTLEIANGPAKLTQALGIISTELSGKRFGLKLCSFRRQPSRLIPKILLPRRVLALKKLCISPGDFILKAIHSFLNNEQKTMSKEQKLHYRLHILPTVRCLVHNVDDE